MSVPSRAPHLGYWVKQVDHAVTIRVNRLLRSSGLTRGSWQLLYHVSEEGKVPQKRLQGLLGVESGSLAIMVEKLVRAGWIQRRCSETDRRARVLQLTLDGTARWKKLPDILSVGGKEMMRGITTADEANAVSVLRKAVTNLLDKTRESETEKGR